MLAIRVPKVIYLLSMASKIFHFDYRIFRTNSWQRFLRYTLPVIFISLSFHLPSFMEMDCRNEHSSSAPFLNKTGAEIFKSETNAYDFWYKDFARLIFFGAIPFLILSFLNLKIFLSIRESRRQAGLQIRDRISARNRRMEVELEQARRSTFIISAYFFFLLLYIAKKFLYMIVYKNDHIPLECMVDPPTLFQRMAKPTQSFE